ncbi:MAG: cytidyltransferase-related domain protein [Myxococcales bacterium]|nr:cytidyltransferase-related domain protein [Myxococcales bacterium]
MSDRGRDDESRMWASGGGWEEPSPPAKPEKDPRQPTPPDPAEKKKGPYGPPKRTGDTGVVCGRFLPLHRGHQYVIDVARASVDTLTVLVFTRTGDPVSGEVRAGWIRELYPDVTVVEVPVTAAPENPEYASRLIELLRLHAGRPSYFFGSELSYRSAADALQATFVPVDPARIAVPTSGSAIRTNVIASYAFLAPSARPWFVRRVAVVGAESTGKSTLCAWLREHTGAAMVPEWTRTLVEAGRGTLRSEDVQLVARSQIASEDALARQGTGGVLVCDTDLHAVWLWARRLFDGQPPAWIRQEIDARPYDLYLHCAPDLPFVGARERDRPEARAAFDRELTRELEGKHVVAIRGTREQRFAAAAAALETLASPGTLLSARGVVLSSVPPGGCSASSTRTVAVRSHRSSRSAPRPGSAV